MSNVCKHLVRVGVIHDGSYFVECVLCSWEVASFDTLHHAERYCYNEGLELYEGTAQAVMDGDE